MKRSKIFLAGTTCLLAIAGIAATKAHRGTALTGFYRNGNIGNCTLASQATGFTFNSGGNGAVVKTQTNKTVYSQSTVNACTALSSNHPLYIHGN